MFVSLGWIHKDPDESPPLSLALLYIFGSLFNNIVLGLGLGYVAFVHNLFAAQLLNVTHRLEHLLAEGQEGAITPEDESYGALLGSPSKVSDTSHIVLLSSNRGGLTVDSLGRQYAEFHRRQDTLSRAFHPRVLIVVFTSGIGVILMVTEGFQENQDILTKLEISSLIALFLANAYSLWTVIFSMGRVPFVSREECAFSAHKWALFKEPDAMPLALTMS